MEGHRRMIKNDVTNHFHDEFYAKILENDNVSVYFLDENVSYIKKLIEGEVWTMEPTRISYDPSYASYDNYYNMMCLKLENNSFILDRHSITKISSNLFVFTRDYSKLHLNFSDTAPKIAVFPCIVSFFFDKKYSH